MPMAMIAAARPTTTIAIERPGPTPPELVVDAAATAPNGEGLGADPTAGSAADGSAPPAELGLPEATPAVEDKGAGEASADDGLVVNDPDGAGLTPAETGVAGIGWIET